MRRPFVISRSFTPTGKPCNRPSSSPSSTAFSAALASLRAASKLSVTTAFKTGFSAWMRVMLASMSATGDSSFFLISAASLVAGRSNISSFLSILPASIFYVAPIFYAQLCALSRRAGRPTPVASNPPSAASTCPVI